MYYSIITLLYCTFRTLEEPYFVRKMASALLIVLLFLTVCTTWLTYKIY